MPNSETVSEQKAKNQIPLSNFPVGEHGKVRELRKLFSEWKGNMRRTLPPEMEEFASGFVTDGFYPNYFDQPLKILFVGRECRGLWGCDYLGMVLHAYRETKMIGRQPLNLNRFNSRMLHIAWGVLHGFRPWKDVPWAEEIGDNFGENSGISFAFMNISKFSNEHETRWQSEWEKIRDSVEASEDFIEKEVSILEPDVIISMNLGKLMGKLGTVGRRHEVQEADFYQITSQKWKSVLIDTWHFSATNKADCIKFYYQPICEAIQQSISNGWVREFSPARSS